MYVLICWVFYRPMYERGISVFCLHYFRVWNFFPPFHYAHSIDRLIFGIVCSHCRTMVYMINAAAKQAYLQKRMSNIGQWRLQL